MSDVGISIPFPIVLALVGAIYWPVTLTIAAASAGVGCVLRPWWARAVCFAVAAVLAADCLLALWVTG